MRKLAPWKVKKCPVTSHVLLFKIVGSKSLRGLSNFHQFPPRTSIQASKFKELARRAESARQSVLFGLKKELRAYLPYKNKKKKQKSVDGNAQQEAEEAEDPPVLHHCIPSTRNGSCACKGFSLL